MKKRMFNRSFKALVLLLAILAGSLLLLRETAPPVLKNRENRWHPSMPLASTGPLRGVLVDLLWIKVNRLNSEKRFREIEQLTGEICHMQPYVPEIWKYMAWNISFNILAEQQGNPEKMKESLLRGFRLIEEGMSYNPDSKLLIYARSWMIYNRSRFYPELKPLLKEKITRSEDPVKWAWERVKEAGVDSSEEYYDMIILPVIGIVAEDREGTAVFLNQLARKFPEKIKTTRYTAESLNVGEQFEY